MDVDTSDAGNLDCANLTQSLRKKLRNEGKSYTTRTGKTVPGRQVRALEGCRKKCNEKISDEQQQTIHKQYWELGSYQLRQAFAAGLIEIEETKTMRKIKSPTNPRTRTYAYKYSLEVNGKKHSVCQKCFRYTLCETEQFIKTIIQKKIEGNGFFANGDMRGKHPNPRKLSLKKENEIIDFINSFPSSESQSSRRKTSPRYLSSDLNVAKIYRLYCDRYGNLLSISKFSNIFHTLNLKFMAPQKKLE